MKLFEKRRISTIGRLLILYLLTIVWVAPTVAGIDDRVTKIFIILVATRHDDRLRTAPSGRSANTGLKCPMNPCLVQRTTIREGRPRLHSSDLAVSRRLLVRSIRAIPDQMEVPRVVPLTLLRLHPTDALHRSADILKDRVESYISDTWLVRNTVANNSQELSSERRVGFPWRRERWSVFGRRRDQVGATDVGPINYCIVATHDAESSTAVAQSGSRSCDWLASLGAQCGEIDSRPQCSHSAL